jgi:hypothetical protein
MSTIAHSISSERASTCGCSLAMRYARTHYVMAIRETLNLLQSENPMERDRFGEQVIDEKIIKLIIKI